MDDFERNLQTIREETLRTAVCRSRPVSLFFLLTMRCPIDCVMCCQKNLRAVTPDFPYEKFERLRPVLPFIDTITWQGGEVFALGYFRDLISELSAAFPRIRHHIITNGLMIGSDWAETLGRVKSYLVFSVDSPVKGTYEDLRKGASFETLAANLARLRDSDGGGSRSFRGINAVVMRRNVQDLRLFPAFCREYGIHHLRFGDLNEETLPEENIVRAGSADEKRSLSRAVSEVESECARLGIRFECVFKGLLEDPGRGGDTGGGCAGERPRCVMPWTNLYVDSRGEVMPHCVCKVSAGNIFEKDFDEIWNGALMQEYRRRVMTGDESGWCSPRCVGGTIDRCIFEGDRERGE